MVIATDSEILVSHSREQALIYAQNGKAESLRAWIGHHPELIAQAGRQLLMRACHHGHRDCATLLLAAGVDVNEKNSDGLTAIDAAARHGHWPIVEDLLIAGANPDGSPRVERHGSATPLMYAAQAGNISMMYHLEERGAVIHYRDSKGQGLMHYASQSTARGAETVRMAMSMLHTPHLSNRQLATVKDTTGETPLHAAARARSVGAIEVLIEMGADPKAINVVGQKPEDLTQDAACLRALVQPTQPSLLDSRSR